MVYKQSNQTGIVRRRFWALLVILALLVGAFFFVLYDLQITHGDEYLERSQRKIAKTDTVEASRGEILDSLGRVLVTNQTKYQATIDLSLMGQPEQRNATLAELIALCQIHGIKWNDNLPITTEQPFQYTTDTPFFVLSAKEDGSEKQTKNFCEFFQNYIPLA